MGMLINAIYKVTSDTCKGSEIEPIIFFDKEKAISYAKKIENENKDDDDFIVCHIYEEIPDLNEGAFVTGNAIMFKHPAYENNKYIEAYNY